ncbi:MAG: CDP-glucose 4,6-dehydratase [Candidatus Melainabacteria bacterium GWF2_32_7]|nr:MAG: CDP-glucose 4,6-dehydratase [Candidatus Melainabacteria bacterium GWF2_32_7]
MNKSFSGIYKGKKVLVTGHTGFKGSWLSLWLTMLGADVIGFSLEPNTQPSLFEAINIEKKISHVVGDIRNFNLLQQVFDKYNPEIVFHLAAQPLVRLSYSEPVTTYETNVMGTLNVFEAARNNKNVKAIVNITSDKCYENKEINYGYKETDPMGGYDPYSSSKGMAELLTNSYRNSFFHPEKYGKNHTIALASGRAGNVIGGGDWAKDRIIPDCIKSLTENKIIEIRSPKATRPWQHVLEPLSGYLLLGQKLLEEPAKYNSGWNFGPHDDSVLTVESIVNKAIKYWGSGEVKIVSENNLHEANLLQLDISKASTYLNWQPVYKLEDSIKVTIEWYRYFYFENQNICEFTENQIINYVENAKKLNLIWNGEEK